MQPADSVCSLRHPLSPNASIRFRLFHTLCPSRSKLHLFHGDVMGATQSRVQLSVMMFLHRLAEESRAKAFEEKSATIKPQHIKDVSKKLLKGARG
ncbi:centromere protein W isoform X1 [Anguilla rostrata]|uniref:centromere protein W isoform X1 n=1 Tax=Anguilla rostrata TaxID=7938 RepID=UPI0030D47953